MPWESMNQSNQKLVWIFLIRIQIPIRVTALGMVEVGVQAMVAVVNCFILNRDKLVSYYITNLIFCQIIRYIFIELILFYCF